MRAIKFRGWDGTKWIEDVVGVHNGMAIVPDYTGYYDSKPVVAVVQYTGLKDKNGKEIYEGDILNTPYSSGDVINGVAIKKVEYDSDGGFFYPFGNHEAYSCIAKDTEVIGNIYEHGHLLEKK